MAIPRSVIDLWSSRPTVEGAGVHLRRAFGDVDSRLDPFLLLDDFGSDQPADYLAGFPWHPHRGMETITYMLEGRVRHGDSIGNRGTIGAGEVQWMTAGSGIVHEEMPEAGPRLRGFQLWSNLPASNKMVPPRYQGIAANSIPRLQPVTGAVVGLICGRLFGASGPVEGVASDPLYADIELVAGSVLTVPIAADHNAFAYVFSGSGTVGADNRAVDERQLAVLGAGDEVALRAGDKGLRCLLVAGRPLRESVAWGGPIVMNTQAELRQAFAEYQDGTFLKHGKQPE